LLLQKQPRLLGAQHQLRDLYFALILFLDLVLDLDLLWRLMDMDILVL
jgi:hypothetical protein